MMISRTREWQYIYFNSISKVEGAKKVKEYFAKDYLDVSKWVLQEIRQVIYETRNPFASRSNVCLNWCELTAFLSVQSSGDETIWNIEMKTTIWALIVSMLLRRMFDLFLWFP